MTLNFGSMMAWIIGKDKIPVRLVHELRMFTFIVAIGAAIRLPFFFPAVINWDESTFIIVGQSVLDGFLPNEIAADLKPPFVFWWFAGAIELFGKTIPGIRFAGFMWLLLSAYLLYIAALLMSGSRLGGVLAAAVFIVAVSAHALHVSTEHLAVLPMAGAILVLCNSGRCLRSVFLGGLLLGLACMFRLNLVYLCAVVGTFLCTETERTSWKLFLNGAVKKGLWFSVGVLVPALLSFLPYLFRGHWQLWLMFYKAAIIYSEEQRSFVKNLVQTLYGSSTDLVGATMWGAAALGVLTISRHWSELGPERRSDWLLCGAFVVGSFLSIVMTGPVHKHYYIQLVPGLTIFAAAAFIPRGKAVCFSKDDWIKFVFGIVLVVVVIFRAAAWEWSALAQRLWRGEPLSYGSAYDIADYIRSQGIEDFSLFAMNNHLVYWLLGRYPPTLLATHPSALGKPFAIKIVEPGHTPEDALRSVFRREPTFVVGPPKMELDSKAPRTIAGFGDSALS
jgi:4-amino-4-deoxy-L-arabinose transferase-like glycosyltransferase